MTRLIRSVLRSIGRAIAHDPEVRRLVERHPRFFHFLRERLRPNERFGLALTVGLSVALVLLYFFASVLEDVASNDTLVRADLRVNALVQMFRTPGVTQVMVFLTDLGRWQTIAAGVVALALVLEIWRRRTDIVALILCLGLGELLLWLVKQLVRRSRPEAANSLAFESGFSFPSGHTFVSVAFYGLATYFAVKGARGPAKILVVAGGIALIVAIGFSRIYLGVHWPSDVLGSFAGGASWLSIVLVALRLWAHGRKRPLPRLGPIQRTAVTALIAIFWAASTVKLYAAIPLPQPKTVEVPTRALSEDQIASRLFLEVPTFGEDITGRPTEPIDVVLVGSKDLIRSVFQRAGWREAAPLSLRSLGRTLRALTGGSPDPEEPAAPSFWNGRPNELTFILRSNGSVRGRRHVQLWNSGVSSMSTPIWVGTAHLDRGASDSSSLPWTVHSIDPFVDRVRQYLRQSLEAAGAVRSSELFPVTRTTSGQRLVGDSFVTDGNVCLILLRQVAENPRRQEEAHDYRGGPVAELDLGKLRLLEPIV